MTSASSNWPFQLSSDEERLLKPALARLSERAKFSITLKYLLDRWSQFVTEVEAGYPLSIDEYTNDLSTRGLLEEILGEVAPPFRDRLYAHIQDWDVRFENATIETDTWGHRVPKIQGDELKYDLKSMGILE